MIKYDFRNKNNKLGIFKFSAICYDLNSGAANTGFETIKLTKRIIENTTPDKSKYIVLRDDQVSGFGIRISSTGRRVFFFRYRLGGRNGIDKRINIGKFGDLTVDEARKIARQYAGEVAGGRDPLGDRNEAQKKAKEERDRARALKISKVAEVYIEKHLKPNNRTWKNTVRILNKEILPHIGSQTLDKFNRQDMTKLVDHYQDRKATALLVFRTMSAMINWSITRGLIEYSPIIGMKAPKPVPPRDRVLSDHEVSVLWEALSTVGMGFEAMFKTLLSTAQRRSEVAGMTWDELDLDQAVWTIPAERSKNKKPHDVDLCPYIVELLQSQPRTGPLVFGGDKPNPPSGISKAKRRVDEEMLLISQMRKRDPNATIAEWRLHDLRRTAATGMARLGHPVEVVEKVLNHVSNARGSLVAVYQRYSYRDERRLALSSWADYVLHLVQDAPNYLPEVEQPIQKAVGYR